MSIKNVSLPGGTTVSVFGSWGMGRAFAALGVSKIAQTSGGRSSLSSISW
jgi:hypothetical protein